MAEQLGIIVLAAGSSSRMGTPKQLLPYQGQNLLERACQTALSSGCHPVVVVLGSEARQISSRANLKTAEVTVNEQWPEGMGSSIRTGLNSLLRVAPKVAAAILMLCDQPFLTPQILLELARVHQQTGKGIVASAYAETFGTPVFFARKYFQALLRLKGPEGAKMLLHRFSTDVASVSFPQGAIDIDTREDFLAMP